MDLTTFIQSHFNGLFASGKLGVHNSYTGAWLKAEYTRKFKKKVKISDVYAELHELQSNSMPTLVVGSKGYFLAKSRRDLESYSKRLRKSIRILTDVSLRVDGAIAVWGMKKNGNSD